MGCVRRRGSWVLMAGALSTAVVSCGGAAPTAGGTDRLPFVAVTQAVRTPAWDAVRDGLKASLESAGYVEGETLRWEWLSAQGNPATATHIAKKYAKADPDVIVAIADLSSASVVKAAHTTPVVFSAVSDPVEDKLVKSVRKPGGNVTGVSDLSPVDQHMALIKEILPEARAVGVIYSASAENASAQIDLIRKEAPKQGFTEVNEMTVTASDEAADAARSLVGFVDAIYVPADPAVMAALESVVQVGQDNNVPVFAEGTDAVARGAIAGISFDYYDIGRQTGDMVAKVLKGRRPEELPVEFVDVAQLFVNPSTAEAMGVSLPVTVIARADEVVTTEPE